MNIASGQAWVYQSQSFVVRAAAAAAACRCGHCKNLAPDWALLSETFSQADGVVIAKVDADAHKDLASTYGVSGFPTIKWFPAGSTSPTDYSGGRSIDELVAHVNKEIGTSKKVRLLALSPYFCFG
jgi:protein disulfide-isomerase-like protein